MRSLLARLREDSVLSTLIRGGSAALFISVAGSAVSTVALLLLARVLPTADYGLYVFLLAGLNVVLLFSNLDLNQVAVRYIGEYRATGQTGAVRGFLRRAHQVVLVSSLSTSIVLSAIAIIVCRTWQIDGLVPILVVAAILPFQSLIILQAGALQGFKRILESGLPNQFIRPLALIVFLSSALLFGWSEIDTAEALTLNLCANVVGVAVAIILLRRVVRQELPPAEPVYRTREWLTVGASFLTITLLHVVLSQQADVLLIGALLNLEGAAIYSIATQLSLPLKLVLNAVLLIASPMISELYASRRHDDLQRMVRSSVRIGVAVAAPVLLAVILFGRQILAFIGPAYAEGYFALVILTASYGTAAFGGGIAGFLMTMTGHHRAAVRLSAISALINIAVTISLLPLLGILGAAIGTATAVLVRLALLTRFLRRTIGISVLPLVPPPKRLDEGER